MGIGINRRGTGLAGLVLAASLAAGPALLGWHLTRPAHAVDLAAPAAASNSLRIFGAVRNPRTYRRADLVALPETRLTVFYATGAGPVTGAFEGVLLWSLLQAAEVRVDPNVRNDILRRTVRLRATGGYEVVLGAGEIAPGNGGEQAIIAYEQDGRPLPQNEGFARLIMPDDKSGGRNVFAVSEIEVR